MPSSSLGVGVAGMRLLTACFIMSASPSWAADIEAGRTKAAQCAVCHGPTGMATAPDAPNLAGQNGMYLVKALRDFKSGVRHNEVMQMMVANLTDADIDSLAAYYSSIEVVVKQP